MKKRVFALILALVMILGVFTVISAEGENADENKVPAKIQWLVDQGLIVGDAGGLRLADELTRAEMARILVVALQKTVDAESVKGVKSAFSDVPTTHWANGSINVAKAAGYISGYEDGKFRPDQKITYAEVMSMLVRVVDNSPAIAAQLSREWPVASATLASEKGILKDIPSPVVGEKAKRGVAFEMLANILNIKNVGQYEIVKAIVLENTRVNNRLAKNEVMFETIKVLQEANFVTESRKPGDQMVKVIDEKVGDVENLLGKVVDFKMDKDGKVVEAKIDDSYKYLMGDIALTPDTLTLGGAKYSVLIDERYNKTDERIFRTYLDGVSYSYLPLAQDFVAEKDAARMSFARVTVKNGRVLFVDAYKFNEIAPVQKVERDGRTVYYYDDAANGSIAKIATILYNNKYVIGYSEKYGFSVMDPKNIKVDDVMHVTKNGMIFRTDALVQGVLNDTADRRWGQTFSIGENEFDIWGVRGFNPVYSYDKEKDAYRTLSDRSELAPLKGKNVAGLLDIVGNLQLLNSDYKFNDGVAIVKQVLSRGAVELMPARGENYRRNEGWGTRYYAPIKNSDGTDNPVYNVLNLKLEQFVKEDLVYAISGEEDGLKLMVKLPVIEAQAAKLNGYYITVGPKDYRYDRATINAFAAAENQGDKDLEFVQIGDWARFIDANAGNTNLKAVIFSDFNMRNLLENTDKAYEQKIINWYTRISNSDFIAHTVLFYGAKGFDGNRDKLYAEVMAITGFRNDRIVVRLANGETRTYNFVGPAPELGTIVNLRLSKAEKEEDKVANPVVVIDRNTPKYRIVSNDGFGNMVLAPLAGGQNEEIYTTAKTDFFGVPGTVIQFYGVDKYNRTEVVRYVSGPAASQGIVTAIDLDSRTVVLDYDRNQMMTINQATLLVDVNGKTLAKGFEIIDPYMANPYRLTYGSQARLDKANNQIVVYSLNTDAAKAVVAKIAALPAEADVKLENKEAIEAARKAYDALSAPEKAAVTNLAKLEAAEKALAKLEEEANLKAAKDAVAKLDTYQTEVAADKIEEAKKAIADAEAAMTKLTADQKTANPDLQKKIDTAKANLKKAEDKKAVADVQKLIDALDEYRDGKVTAENKDAAKKAADDAKAAYDKLTQEQQREINNYAWIQDVLDQVAELA